MNLELPNEKQSPILFNKNIELRNKFTGNSIFLNLKTDGEKITASKIDGNFDFIQIITEKLEQNTWNEGLIYLKEKSHPYPYHLQFVYIQTIEKLAGSFISLPARANYLRTIILELERIISHTNILAKIAQVISYPFFYSQITHVNSQIKRIIEDYFSNKNNENGLIQIGGFACNLTNRMATDLRIKIDDLMLYADKLRTKITKNIVFKNMFKEAGFVSREVGLKYSLVGPIARSLGITDDVRKTDPYAAYSDVYFTIPVSDRGDLYGEITIFLDEIKESLSIILQLLENLPNGSIKQDITEFEIPAKNILSRIETPAGEMFCFVISKNGTLDSTPKIFRSTTPQKINIQGFLSRLSGEAIDNLPLILSTIGEGWSVV